MFNLKKGGEVAIVKGGVRDKEIIYLDSNVNSDDVKRDKTKKYFNELNLDSKSIFEPYPNTSRERDALMIVGQSGSGKTHYLNQYISNYKKAYKKRKVYFISSVESDKSVNEKNVQRISLNDSWINDPILLTDVADSLVCIDDFEAIRDAGIKKSLFIFINEILTMGRHHNISVALIVHYANGKNYLRDMLNECTSFTYFPRSSSRANNYLLENYLGVDPKEIKKIKKIKSRWASVFRNFPSAVLTERNLFMLADLQDD